MSTFRSLRQVLTLAAVSATSAWIGASQAKPDAPTYEDGVLRVRRIELVNKDGELGLVAQATTAGGGITWYLPHEAGDLPADCGREVRTHQAFFGSIFEGSIDFTMRGKFDESSNGIHMSVHGRPERFDMLTTRFGETRNLVDPMGAAGKKK